jgi:hypothetical protein
VVCGKAVPGCYVEIRDVSIIVVGWSACQSVLIACMHQFNSSASTTMTMTFHNDL